MRNNVQLMRAVKLALAVNAGMIGISVGSGALAQEEGAQELEEITVTGSRIKKKDFVSNAPVATIGVEQIDITGTVNVESLLNTLPQTVPGLDRTSNNPGAGAATVDLRGLGSGRTLVLINGTRVVPTFSGGTVDVNAIPNALIENIEVLTGGASAVYGSDAVAGVVNFILKDDFEGAEVNFGYEITQDGDAPILSTDVTLGANLYDGRGNVTLNFSLTDRDELFQGDRDFAVFAQFDDVDESGNPILIDGGSSGIPGTSIFAGSLGAFSPDSFGVTFDPDGSIRPFQTGETNDFYNYAPVNYIQLPQTRYQATSLGHFDINESATVYGRAMFTSSQVPQQLAPTPIFQVSTFTLDGSPFLTADSQQVLSDALGDGVDTDGDGIDDTATAFLRRRLLEVGPRVADSDFDSFQVQAGLRGEITETWDYDGYVQYGNVSNSETQLGNVSRARFDQALLLDLSDPTGNTCQDPTSNGATVGCAPINIFGEGNISPQGAEFLRTRVSGNADFDQVIVAASVSGTLGETLELPGGEIGAAFGIEHIENEFDFRPSQDLATGNIAGFNGSPPIKGGYDVDAIYGELYLPLLAGAPFAELLDLELAYRSSDYTTAGSVAAYKIAGSWAPTEQIRFRGGFNRAVRAPSIGELFAPQGENFPAATDPCSAEGTNVNDPAVRAICEATGVPPGQVGSPAINLPAGQVRAVTGGNPDLFEESADTITAGIVFTPNFLQGLQLTVDYFDIEIEDFITEFGGGASNVLNTCYDPSAPGGGIGSEFCNVIDRRSDGTINAISLTSQNVAVQTLKGVDILGSYDTELWGGDLRVNYVGTYTTESDFTAFAGADVIECAGNFGLDCGEPLPKYKHRMTFNWTLEDYTVQLSWRHVGEADDDAEETFFVEKLSAEAYFDLTGVYRFTDNYSVAFGIDNVLDADPPILGDNQEQANTWPATYDVFGRTFFLKATAQF